MEQGQLSVSTMLRAMLEAGAQRINIVMRDGGENVRRPLYVVTAHMEAAPVHGQATSLGRATALVYEAVVHDQHLTPTHARDRARVHLPDGGLGTLTHVNMHQHRATVQTDEGRWRHLPLASLSLYEGEA
jgi:hypothetical protein